MSPPSPFSVFADFCKRRTITRYASGFTSSFVKPGPSRWYQGSSSSTGAAAITSELAGSLVKVSTASICFGGQQD